MTADDVDATAWPWRSSYGAPPVGEKPVEPAVGKETVSPRRPGGPEDGAEARLDPSFFRRPAEVVAPDLLGTLLTSHLGGARTSGVIVEVEAYVGPEDPASHARESVGRTARNASMFGPPGIAYVYRSYGIHWCMNVVTGEVDHPVAVLVRALDPLEGRETMARRRGRDVDLCSGPGRLTQALGITGEEDGTDLCSGPLTLRRGWLVEEDRIGRSGRIGIRRAADWPLRFYLKGHPSVSRRPSR